MVKFFIKYIFFAVVIFIVGGILTVVGFKLYFRVTDYFFEKNCDEKGGYAMVYNDCILPAADSGKPCTDNSQCERGCVLKGKSAVCANWENLRGCHTFLWKDPAGKVFEIGQCTD